MSIREDDTLDLWEGMERRSGIERRKEERRKLRLYTERPDRRKSERRSWRRRRADREEY